MVDSCRETRYTEIKDTSISIRGGGRKMANLVMICGPQAVGKMTVAESLRDKIKYNLMINHDTI